MMKCQVRPDAPVVLHEKRDMVVVGVVDDERLIGLAAPQRHRKQQVAIVNPAVAVVVEARKVLDEFDPAILKHPEIEAAVHTLPLASGAQRVRAAHERRGVGQLESLLDGAMMLFEGETAGQSATLSR